MNDLTIFQFKENQEIRILERDGEPWFVAKDVCDILDIENSRDTLAKMLDDDEKGVENIYTLGGNQDVNIINESGLYNLIFRSTKPEAKAFRKWVTSDVLPSIRKKGFYALPGLMERMEALIERQSKALEDPKEVVYSELEKFVQRNLEVDPKRIQRVYVRSLWHAYEKKVLNPLNEHEFMHKIALDHPEFELCHTQKEGWYFTRCSTFLFL
jgi:prophage antirepressor-like protein